MDILPNGTKVRTSSALHNKGNWSTEARAERKAGVTGVVMVFTCGSHGNFYHVLHDDKSCGYYDPDELSEVVEPAAEPPEWKQVTYDTFRLEVPGGWLYRYDGLKAMGMTFVPTPK